MAAAHSEENECLLKKGYSWTREASRQLISLYEEMKELFQNVNYKKKQVWEIIAVRMQSGKSGSSRRAEQCEGKWKALTLSFRKYEDHNNKTGDDRRECPFYKELSEVYGYRPNVRPYATASSSGHGDSARRQKSGEEDEEDEENDKERSQATNKRHSDAAGISSTPQETPKKTRRGLGKRIKNECLSWLQDYAEEKRKEQEAQRERAEQHHREKMELLSGLLNVFKDLNN